MLLDWDFKFVKFNTKQNSLFKPGIFSLFLFFFSFFLLIIIRNNSRGEIAVKASDFTAYLIGSNRKRIEVNLSENADGTLTASYTVSSPGSYKCYILLVEYLYSYSYY